MTEGRTEVDLLIDCLCQPIRHVDSENLNLIFIGCQINKAVTRQNSFIVLIQLNKAKADFYKDVFINTGGMSSCSITMLSGSEQKKYIEKVIYRKFSEIRYNRYVHQYPRWPESYVVEKIIKDWSDMSEDQKKVLMHLYKDKKLITSDDQCDSNSQSLKMNQPEKSQKEVVLKEQIVAEQIIVPPAIITMVEEKQSDLREAKASGQDQLILPYELDGIQKNDAVKDTNKDQRLVLSLEIPPSPSLLSQLQFSLGQPDHEQVLKPLPEMKRENISMIKVQKEYIFKSPKQLKLMILHDKSKKEECGRLSRKVRQKQQSKQKKSTEYLQFYVFYYQRIKAKHPELTNVNITRAIIHLWKQRKLHNMEQRRQDREKKIWEKGHKSGRELFFKEKGKEGLKPDEIKRKWMRLPFDGRMYWNNMKYNLDSIQPKPTKVLCKAVFQKGRKNRHNEPQWSQQILLEQQQNEDVYSDQQIQKVLNTLSSKQPVLEISSHANPFTFINKLIPMNS